jgi:2-polyprenyl-6-methoxyphenol hydroxylase-like FAD-dependent oxidoreductase
VGRGRAELDSAKPRFDNEVKDIYISADIEADGPIPGPYSMLAFGLAVAGTFDGTTFEARDPAALTFYRELKPVSEYYDPRALSVSGLDREALASNGSEPSEAMRDAAQWVLDQATTLRPVLVGYPVVFDWMFLHWYFVRFVGQSPFGFGSALDIKTIYQQKARVTFDSASRDKLPPELSSQRSHTHNALDDAIEQAEIFNRLFVWRGP